MKRYLLGMLVAAFVLAGCGGSTEPDPDPNPTPSSPIEGQWIGNSGNEDATDEDYVAFDVWLELSDDTLSNDGDNVSEVVVRLAGSSDVSLETNSTFITGSYDETSDEVSFEADLGTPPFTSVRTVRFEGTLTDSTLSGEVTVRGENDDVLASFTSVILTKQ